MAWCSTHHQGMMQHKTPGGSVHQCLVQCKPPGRVSSGLGAARTSKGLGAPVLGAAHTTRGLSILALCSVHYQGAWCSTHHQGAWCSAHHQGAWCTRSWCTTRGLGAAHKCCARKGRHNWKRKLQAGLPPAHKAGPLLCFQGWSRSTQRQK